MSKFLLLNQYEKDDKIDYFKFMDPKSCKTMRLTKTLIILESRKILEEQVVMYDFRVEASNILNNHIKLKKLRFFNKQHNN